MLIRENAAFIDGANVHKAIESLGWKLDYLRFRVWLRERYGVDHAYLFLGNVPKYSAMYGNLQRMGYILIFKQTTYNRAGKLKGNCDADLVLEAVKQMYEDEYDQAVIVSSDGDYTSLVSFLMGKKRFRVLLSPAAPDRCSILLNVLVRESPIYQSFNISLPEKKKPPTQTKPRKGLFRSDIQTIT